MKIKTHPIKTILCLMAILLLLSNFDIETIDILIEECEMIEIFSHEDLKEKLGVVIPMPINTETVKIPKEEKKFKPILTKDGEIDYFHYMVIETKRREGFEPLPYDDGGEIAVGYGTHIDEKMAIKIWNSAGLTKSEGKALMTNSTKRKSHPLGLSEIKAREMMFDWFRKHRLPIETALPDLKPNQVLAVMSLAYNCGWGGVQRSKLFPLLAGSPVDSGSFEETWIKVKNGRDINGDPKYDLMDNNKTNHEHSREYEVNLFFADVSEERMQKMMEMHEYAFKKIATFYK